MRGRLREGVEACVWRAGMGEGWGRGGAAGRRRVSRGGARAPRLRPPAAGWEDDPALGCCIWPYGDGRCADRRQSDAGPSGQGVWRGGRRQAVGGRRSRDGRLACACPCTRSRRSLAPPRSGSRHKVDALADTRTWRAASQARPRAVSSGADATRRESGRADMVWAVSGQHSHRGGRRGWGVRARRG